MTPIVLLRDRSPASHASSYGHGALARHAIGLHRAGWWIARAVAAACGLVATSVTILAAGAEPFVFADPPAAHPLVGKLYDGRHHLIDAATGGGPGSPDNPTLEGTLGRAVGCGTVAVLGEVHDNPIHHRWRAWLLGQWRGRADVPADCNPRGLAGGGGGAVLEHIRADKQEALSGFSIASDEPVASAVDRLLAALGWDSSGWPKQEAFKPLFAALLDARLPLYAGDPARQTIRAVSKEGLGVLGEEERRRLALDQDLAAGQMDALLEQLEDSHCGLMPKSAFGNLALAQRYRDATLADVTLRAVEAHGSAVLLTGNGHVRADRGAPWYLRQRAPDMPIVSLAIVEVEAGKTDPAQYVPRDPTGRAAVDYVLFTPAAERPDPCEEMRKRFKPRQG